MLTLKHITQNDADLETARHLFKEYADELAVDLCFQSFDEELQNPLKKYGPPTGCLIMAFWDNKPVATVALQALEEFGIGEALVKAILIEAKKLGYTKMKLDTLERLKAAIALYLKHGFVITTAYYHNPLPEVVYMEKSLKG
jgi:putative acetyltransferase